MQRRKISKVGGALLMLWGCGTVEAGDERPPSFIFQDRPTNSPNVIGDHNQVIINPIQERRITKRDEFI